MKRLLKPKRLRKGDVIGVVTPASPVQSGDKLEAATRCIEGCGYRVKFGRHVGKALGYLAGSDTDRADDLHRMFADKKVTAVFCLRGGYGTPRLLRLLDYDLIARNPKIFVGFSDITALSNAILAKSGLITFSGPMLASDMSEPDAYSQDVFWRMLTSGKVFGELCNAEATTQPLKLLRAGQSVGRLIGGNLSLMSALVGTEFLPKMKDALFFFEEIGEKPYRIDRMLSQFENAGLLETLGGFIAGQLTHCEPEKEKPSLTLPVILSGYVARLPRLKPAVSNLTYGHTRQKLTIPIGATAKLRVKKERCALEIIETVVC